MTDRRTFFSSVAFVAFSAAVAAIIVEALLLTMLHVPGLTGALPRPMRRLVQQVYRHFNRSLIQFDPDCAQYDAGLTYTLKPGTCTFANIEFRTTVHVNRLGLRDDEAALAAPEVIAIGDSHTMGWGVEEDQTFGRVLARKSGLKVLNAGISSYGTVREMMLLDRLDVSKLRVLVLQYSDNDLVENQTFRAQGDHLPITTEAEYDKVRRYYARQRSYYPGKYVYRLFMKAVRLEAPEPDQLPMEPASPADEARLFINALSHAGHAHLDNVRVIVLEVNEQLQPRRPFIVAVEQAKRDPENPRFVRELTTLDLSTVLEPKDFYVLDDHMNPRGHQVVGEALAKLIDTSPAGGR
jgi:lysophospholipase L1-like esterase